MRLKRLIRFTIILALIGIVGVIGLRVYSAVQANGRIYTVDDVPQRPVAIVFGAQVLPSGRLSAMLADRVKVGVQLYQVGKVKALLFTDDTIAPNQISDFVQESYNSFSSQPNFQRQLTATYKHQTGFGPGNIRLMAFLLSNKELQSKLISQEAACRDSGNSTQIQMENGITYIYTYCNQLGYTGLSLLWTNGDWVIKAAVPATSQADANLLVQFINNYPF